MVVWSEQRIRVATFAVALVVSAWLLGSSLSSYRTSLALAEVALTGQAERDLFSDFRMRCSGPPDPRRKKELDECVKSFVEEHRRDGVLYAAIGFNERGEMFSGLRQARLSSEVGERASPYEIDVEQSFRGRPVPFGDRYVYIMPPNPDLSVQGVPTHVIEFVPLRALELTRRGLGTLIAGLLGSAVTLVGALLLLRVVRQREAAQLQAREKQQLALLGQMSAVMAHELRNPLASAKGHSQLLAEMLEPGTRTQRKAEQVVTELLRVELLLNDLLDFVRSGRVRPQLYPLKTLLSDVTSRAASSAPVVVDAEGAPEIWSLDPYAMERVLLNLLRNAAQAQGESSAPISLIVRQRGEELYLAVRDSGAGVSDGVDVFAPFATTKSSGTGLGLVVSRQSVEAHGGRISLKNHPEGGAIAEVYLPAR